MSYQVIARKWRPQSFADLKGQSTTRRTLINAVKNDRLHHALLFTGPRGTGKTSTARILAKILRCENLSKGFLPCDKCSSCTEIINGRSLDVLEIDGASNNGVDAVRELREQVSFNPTSGKNKVYIIDEVHMLSGAAFNALLKTLEEPPENVYFMLATTEVHKLPKTILSRCQKYDFKPVPLNEVEGLLKEILKAENFDYEDEAVFLLAQAGGGCVRDSLSFLDQNMTFSEGNTLTAASVVENLGIADINQYKKILEILINRDSKSLVPELEKITIDPQVYLEDLVIHLKNLIMFKVDGDYLRGEAAYSEVEKSIYSDLSKEADLENLYYIFDVCFKGSVSLGKAFHPLSLLQVTLIKASTAPKEAVPTKVQANVQTKIQSAKKENIDSDFVPAVEQSLDKEEQKQKKQDNDKPKGWVSFVSKVKDLNPVVGSKLELCKYDFDRNNKILSLSATDKAKFMEEQLRGADFLNAVQNYIQSFWGEKIEVKYTSAQAEELKTSAKDESEQIEEQKLVELKKKIENLDVIKSMKQKYKVEIKEIKHKGERP